MMTDKISVSIVAKINNAATRYTLFDLGAIPSGFPDFAIEANTFSSAGNKWGLYTNNNSLDGTVATSTNLTSLSLIANNTYTAAAGNLIPNTSFYVNGTASPLSCRSCVTGMYRTAWPNGFVIGNFNGAYSTYTDGFIPEFIVFPSALSNTNRQFLEWSQSQYYSIGGPVLSGIPPAAPSAFVTTWYDQSGNGRDVIQPATANQPKIINSGKMSLQNGLPAISLDGSSTWLIQPSMSIPQPYTLNAIATRTANNGNHQRLINISATGDSYGYLGVFNGDYATFNGNGAATWNDIAACTPLTSVALNSQAIMTMVSGTGATGLIPTVNGTNLNLKNGTSVTGTGFLLGGAWNTNQTSQIWPGTMSEFHIFTSALSATRRRLLETNQATYYNKTISNSKYTPPSSTTYNLYVNGIGRESATDSVGGTRRTVGMGVSVTTASTAFLKDNGDYLTYGMNCRSIPHTSINNLPAAVVQRWENDWYVNKTDVNSNNGILSIYFDFSDYGVAMTPGVAANYVLINRNSATGTFTIVPGTTVMVVGDRVIFEVNASDITTNFYYTIGTKDVATSPLPIELVEFTCNPIDSKTVELKWITASESNSSHFMVERSTDAITYEPIGTKNASGNSTTTLYYSLRDVSALKDISYYRLKSVDVDGSYKYSPICSVTNEIENDGDLNIYPNPTNGSITIDFNHSAYNEPDSFSILDITGKKIEVIAIRHVNSVTLDLSSLKPGMYLLEVLKGNHKTVKKIALQK
jgi:hypothetical protein